MLAVELKPDRDPWITKPVARRKKPSSSSLHALSMHLKMSMSEYKALPSQCLFCSLSLGKHTLSRFPNVWLKFDLQSSRLFKFYLTRKAQIKQVARHPVRNLWTLSSDLNKGIFFFTVRLLFVKTQFEGLNRNSVTHKVMNADDSHLSLWYV